MYERKLAELEAKLKAAMGSDDEIARLRALLLKLRCDVYIPKKDDLTDAAVAKYINEAL